jgi:hypothetical protein
MFRKSPPEALGSPAPERVGKYEVDQVDLKKHAGDNDEARAQIKRLEKDGPPTKLTDWPTGKAMFLTFGRAEGGDEGYEEGNARQMGPSSLRHYADGSVSIRGEKVDNPKAYSREQSVKAEAEESGAD